MVIAGHEEVQQLMRTLFPHCRSLTGQGNRRTLEELQSLIPELRIHEIPSGTEVFDWTVPAEWEVRKAFVENAAGERILDFQANNLHLVSYSVPFSGTVSEDTLLQHLHTLPERPEWIPYRTSYYKRDWGFCAPHSLVESDKFHGPFVVHIDTAFHDNGVLNYGEAIKPGQSNDEILISTYCCHPSLANDNLSGLITAALLFRYIQSHDTRFTYRLAVVPETIGALCFLSHSQNIDRLLGGTVVTTTAGPDEVSMKEAFDSSHWINRVSHMAISDFTCGNYTVYPFVPDGSDERQYASPQFRIPTPSFHKSKYYEYDEYHTSADNLSYVSAVSLCRTLELYKQWFHYVDSYCYPTRVTMAGEFQLGKRGLYPDLGGTVSQPVHQDNVHGAQRREFSFDQSHVVTGEHLEIFNWLMHLCDGSVSNVDIAERSGCSLRLVNESIALFLQKGLVTI